jgi:hypothetical protein
MNCKILIMPIVAFDVNEHKVEVVHVKPNNIARVHQNDHKAQRQLKNINKFNTCLNALPRSKVQATLHGNYHIKKGSNYGGSKCDGFFHHARNIINVGIRL